MEIPNKAKRLYELILTIPVDLNEIKKEIENSQLSAEELGIVAYEYANECFYEGVEIDDEDNENLDLFFSSPAVVIPNHHSTYFLEVIELLLQYGLDPNTIVEDDSLLDTVRYVHNEYIAADTLALLFANGADIDLKIKGSRVFHDIDFDVSFDAFNQHNRRYYDSLVHCWFVWLGYGARMDNGESGLELYTEWNTGKEFDLAKLRNHRDYDFCLSRVPSHGENWSLHIFEKKTLWEVARL